MEHNNIEEKFGYSVARFINEVMAIESDIGHKTDDGLTVVGIIVSDSNNYTKILSNKGINLDDKIFNDTSKKALKAYLKKVGITSNELLKKIEEINNKELLLLPIKPDYNCTIEHTVNSNVVERVKTDSTVEFIKWKFNSDTKSLDCKIISNGSFLNNERLKVNLDEYNKSYWVKDIEGNVVQNETYYKNHELVHINPRGYVNTIEVKDTDGNILIIDNTYIYYKNNDNLEIIGYWNKFDHLVIDKKYTDIKDNKLYKEIEKSIPYIAQHRVYIAPYILTH